MRFEPATEPRGLIYDIPLTPRCAREDENEEGEFELSINDIDHPDLGLHLFWKKGAPKDALENARENFANNVQNAKEWRTLWGTAQTETAIVLSCGPSLVDSLPLILEAAKEKKATLIGINRTANVAPLKYFVCMERHALEEWFVRDVSGMRLISCLSVAPHVLREYPWKGIFLGTTWEAGIGLKQFSWTGDTLTTGEKAIYIAARMGFKKILLAGFDFAIEAVNIRQSKMENDIMLQADAGRYYFDKDFRRSWTGSHESYQDLMPIYSPVNDEVVLICGELVRYCQWTRARCEMVERLGCKVFNCSPRGILVHNNRPLELCLR